ncbi:tRNA pseudouridine(38-40) synthase TruA [Magnetovibrio blakemorei]|uniref:tRNA pseudouridine synthase A n=1 Tax=Magnetovibrio blakemorei TaxID=28181 RepID=A0A1E5QB52_9PROT|nr:tRNA pseudouridine(38-40) synthase TruA [Magnetovibrio blakemorei]OEJ69260.1 tRNA pseudouridine(38-40) synthase TruA [Magnetovibrio blakemorei]
MVRYRLQVEYDGGPFVGWQRQETGLGVQQIVEEAILAFSGESPRVFCAGRTDAGVHACGQVAHFDLQRADVSAKTVQGALNHHMKPHPVSIVHAEIVDEDFHARFSATEREYLFRILNRPARPALERGHVWWVPQPLDDRAMHDAAQVLVGKHDFTTFRATMCQAKSPLKTLDELTVTRVGTQAGEELHIKARARSFLHHQVRNMVGTLNLVGLGKWTSADLQAALDAKDRAAGGPTSPPDGLYLMRVGYDKI